MNTLFDDNILIFNKNKINMYRIDGIDAIITRNTIFKKHDDFDNSIKIDNYIVRLSTVESLNKCIALLNELNLNDIIHTAKNEICYYGIVQENSKIPHGTGSLFYSNGCVKFIGDFFNGIPLIKNATLISYDGDVKFYIDDNNIKATFTDGHEDIFKYDADKLGSYLFENYEECQIQQLIEYVLEFNYDMKYQQIIFKYISTDKKLDKLYNDVLTNRHLVKYQIRRACEQNKQLFIYINFTCACLLFGIFLKTYLVCY